MDIRSTQVNLTGLLHVLGKNLYSTPNVAIRELVQNAHDSCTRRAIEANDEFSACIEVRVDSQAGVLSIVDNGAGLLEQEIIDYLATVGSGYTRGLRADSGSEDLIGAFGLGFLSAYVVADRVEFWTCSYQSPNQALKFSSNGGERYRLSEAVARPIGTEVQLFLKDEFAELADADNVRAELERYCVLLNIPVMFADEQEPVNRLQLPWRQPDELPAARYRKLCQDVVQMFEPQFETLCQLPVKAETGPAVGLLWIHDTATYGSSDNRNLSVFVRGMQISDEVRELLPSWAGWLGGIIESNTLTPTASRESLQKDEAYEQLRQQLHETLIDGLANLAKQDRATWRRLLSRHNEALLGAALCDERLYAVLADELKLPTTEGQMTAAAIAKRSQGRIFISSGEQRGAEELIFRALRRPVVLGSRYAALPFALGYAERAKLKAVLLGTDAGNRDLFKPASLPAANEATLKWLFAADDVDVEIASFEPAELPLLTLVDRDALMKSRLESDQADARIGGAALGLARLHTAKKVAKRSQKRYVNSQSPLIRQLLSLTAERQRQMAGLLTAFSVVSSGVEDEDGSSRLDDSLLSFNQSLLALLAPDDGLDIAGSSAEQIKDT